jgi:hypothetical protein
VKYRDGITLYTTIDKASSNPQAFQTALNNIEEWAHNINMLMNANKIQLINLSLSEPHHSEVHNMRNVPIIECDSAKLLGVTVYIQ